MTAPVFVAEPDALAGDVPQVRLEGSEGRHAAVVRRLRPGEPVVLTDGRGTSAECVVLESSRSGLVCEVRRRRTIPAPRPRLVVVQALPKGERAELAVQMLTEVGADVIVPWAAARCVVQWRGERAAKALAKWRAHAREAGKQARRSWLPDVRELAGTDDVAALLGRCTLSVVLHEQAERPLTSLPVPDDGDIAVVVGPEGGLTDEEVARFDAAGATAVRLGSSVLRTSTAGVAAASALLSRTPRWS
ncbi:MAG: 16S rRNA (uracil(1498)-N(3))-methyltransferase [Actinomycetota bacterium]|nr:16S rRNA (uracil(1498)-N(3))-methyltransferase [Actinomycetota bacterium]